MSAATQITAAGQVLVVKGERNDVALMVKAARTSAVGSLRDFETVDGETVTVDAQAVAMIAAAGATRRRRVGFIRDEEE